MDSLILFMIIRYCTPRTLKASPLRNRRSERPADGMQTGMHPGGVPHQWHGATHSGSVEVLSFIRGCSLRSYPRLRSGDRVAVLLVVSLRIVIFMNVAAGR